ncbi:hypothetical protein EWB00_000379 [Schistosoma japonicum]|uniref:Uncharacterized protein n=1 Tax=Schistosoma japonicum TaxID=6182 RepID=A0A4Z2DJA8_SCHJA|nr:hypothetical protein EWB00_000379 [Schistosoma japonicum]
MQISSIITVLIAVLIVTFSFSIFVLGIAEMVDYTLNPQKEEVQSVYILNVPSKKSSKHVVNKSLTSVMNVIEKSGTNHKLKPVRSTPIVNVLRNDGRIPAKQEFSNWRRERFQMVGRVNDTLQ